MKTYGFKPLVLALTAAALIPATAAAQYYIKKEQPEKTVEENTSEPSAPATPSTKRSIFVAPKREAPKSATSKTAGQDQATTELPPDFKLPPEFSRENFKKMFKERHGECSEEDKAIIDLVGKGFDQYNKEMNDYVDSGIQSGKYDDLEGIDVEKARLEYEKTGKLPKEYSVLMKENPEKAMKIASTITQKQNMELFALSSLRCTDLDAVLEQSDIGKLLPE